MSSISVGELINRLKEYPDYYEVIMCWSWKEKEEKKKAIAMINGIEPDDKWREVRLLN